MKTEKEPIAAEPLSAIFEDKWDVFTVDAMDDKVVSTVLKNAVPPENAPHVPTLRGIKEAAQIFCDINGQELLKAVQLLEGK